MNAPRPLILQDIFLNQVRKDRTPLTIHLTNGFQLKGTIKGFDSFVIILESDGKQMMIYKHAISTLTPARPVSFAAAERMDDEKAEDQAE